MGWVVLAIVDLSLWPTLAMVAVLNVVEFLGPWVAERVGRPTPWHAHHIAERYSLFAIIALGEGVVGTVAALSLRRGPLRRDQHRRRRSSGRRASA